MIAAAACGVLTWTLLEYLIHRWMGHDRRFRRTPFGVEHVRHHIEGNYFAPTWKKLVAAAIAAAVLCGPAIAIAGIRLVGRRLGHSAAGDRLAADLAKRRDAVRARVALSRSARPKAVILIWPDPPQAAGGGTFLNDLLTEAGGDNLLAARAGWPLVSPEWLATAPIDVLVVPDSAPTRGAYERAFREGPLSRGTASAARVVRVEESVLTRPGPRVFDALERLARELAR